MKTASQDNTYNLIFPGIGIDYRQFIKDSKMDQNPDYLKYCKLSNQLSGIDIAGYVEGKQVDDPILVGWCTIYTVDCILYERILGEQIEPRCMAGYSMGLITALKCAGSISYIDGINCLKIIRSLRTASENETMTAFIGWEYGEMKEFLDAFMDSDKASIACENNQYCFIVSGDQEAIDELGDKALEEGIMKVRKLAVDSAFHTARYKEPSKELKVFVDEINVKVPNVPLLSVIDQKWITTEEEVRDELVRNLYCKMKWHKSVSTMLELGESKKKKFLEVSFGDMLTKVSRIIDSKGKFYTYNTIWGTGHE